MHIRLAQLSVRDFCLFGQRAIRWIQEFFPLLIKAEEEVHESLYVPVIMCVCVCVW